MYIWDMQKGRHILITKQTIKFWPGISPKTYLLPPLADQFFFPNNPIHFFCPYSAVIYVPSGAVGAGLLTAFFGGALRGRRR